MKKQGTLHVSFKSFDIVVDKETNTATVEGLTAKYGNVDRGGDIIMHGAMKSADGMNVPFMYNHEDTIGIAALTETGEGLKSRAEINLNLQSGKDALALLEQFKRHNTPFGMSIGYLYDWEKDVNYEKGIRYLKSIEILESTMTPIPMNPDANIKGLDELQEAIKSLVGVVKDLKSVIKENDEPVEGFKGLEVAAEDYYFDPDGAEVRVKRLADKEGQDILEKAFMLCIGDPKDIKSYHLLIADVVDDQLKAIPKAIEAAKKEAENNEAYKSIRDSLTSFKTVNKTDKTEEVKIEDFKGLSNMLNKFKDIGGKE